MLNNLQSNFARMQFHILIRSHLIMVVRYIMCTHHTLSGVKQQYSAVWNRVTGQFPVHPDHRQVGFTSFQFEFPRLVENLDEHKFAQKNIIVSTTLWLVISSTILFGSFTPIVKNFLLPSTPNKHSIGTELTEEIKSPLTHSVNMDGDKIEF